MESVTIPCYSVKDGLPFSVEIDPNELIAFFVKPIAAELNSKLQQRKLPADMQLYLARMGGEWLDLAGAKAVTLDDRDIPVALDGHGQLHYFEEMDPFYSLSSDRYFGGDFRADGKILVLVVESALPRLEHKRKLERSKVPVPTASSQLSSSGLSWWWPLQSLLWPAEKTSLAKKDA